MSEVMEHTGDWRCHFGRHHFLAVVDDNPEVRGQSYLECSRCGKKKDPPSYGPMPPSTLGPGIAMG